MKKAKLKEIEARLTGEEFDRLYDRAIERMRRDPESDRKDAIYPAGPGRATPSRTGRTNMADRRLSKLQRFILATAWERYRRGLEKPEKDRCGLDALAVYTDEIYRGFYHSFCGRNQRYPHKFAASISRSLKQIEGFFLKRFRYGGETSFIVFKSEGDIASVCRSCWEEGGLKLTASVNNKGKS
jgi:hypothetical protein